MTKVLIYGAGSIGNHLAHASRDKGWDVTICDVDPAALERTRSSIYPSRYGSWDKSIRLTTPEKIGKEAVDVAIIGAPPDSHIKIALEALRARQPRVMLIEKPLCPPDLKGCAQLVDAAKAANCVTLVGYNHAMCRNTLDAEGIIKNGLIGSPLSITVRWLEYWGGIFSAHPWLNGPQDSYLGFSGRGGGACGEHSHAIHIWQHFANLVGKGRIVEVSCMMDVVSEGGVRYDRLCQMNVMTEQGLTGLIAQDVITEPSVKTLRIQGDRGYLEWYVNFEKGQDALIHGDGKGDPARKLFAKTRPDDFKGEIEHIGSILSGETSESPISLTRGLETALAICAAHRSHELKRTVRINYAGGFNPDSVVPV